MLQSEIKIYMSNSMTCEILFKIIYSRVGGMARSSNDAKLAMNSSRWQKRIGRSSWFYSCLPGSLHLHESCPQFQRPTSYADKHFHWLLPHPSLVWLYEKHKRTGAFPLIYTVNRACIRIRNFLFSTWHRVTDSVSSPDTVVAFSSPEYTNFT